jgi:CheY-like chemotaxis protein
MACARVVVIEPDGGMRAVLFDILEMSGMPCCAVASPSEAMSVLASGCEPALFVIDVPFPAAPIAHLIGLLRTVPRLRNVPILATTALPAEMVPEDVDALLSQPFGVDQFLDTVQRLLDRRPPLESVDVVEHHP